MEHVKKSRKMKGEKLAKSQKFSKLGKFKGKKSKKLSKNENSSNFNANNNGTSFLTRKLRTVLNCLWLAFTKAPIL